MNSSPQLYCHTCHEWRDVAQVYYGIDEVYCRTCNQLIEVDASILDSLIAANLLRTRTLLDAPVPLVGETERLLALADELIELWEQKEDTADEQTD